jgi:regulator of protease activity HflC (stomatin/prohibitin superfamily)
MQERSVSTLSGIPALLAIIAIDILAIWLIVAAHLVIPGVLVIVISAVMLAGLFTVQPNQGRVLQLFGKYVGTERTPGLRLTNPFYSKTAVSLRVRNFESSKLKVNDLEGNPIEIAAVVVWQVTDTAQAVFQVDDYENFVEIQSEAAIRSLASSYPYDQHEGEIALRSHADQVARHLAEELQARLNSAGVEILEARITHLAYAPEIAHAMLQRQQASAIIAARTKIVEGAVGMVQMALVQLTAQGVVELDEERRAQMVANLLVVLCSERGTQPVINTGSIHQ